EAPDRALILKDEREARLFLRYQSEARSTFHRAYAALIKAIDRRQEEAEAEEEVSPGQDDPAPESVPRPIEEPAAGEPTGPLAASPAEAVAGASEAVSRNEANEAGEASQDVRGVKVSIRTSVAARMARGGPKGGRGGVRTVEVPLGADLTDDP